MNNRDDIKAKIAKLMALGNDPSANVNPAEVFTREDCVKLVRAIHALCETDAGRCVPQDIQDEAARIVSYADAHGVCP